MYRIQDNRGSLLAADEVHCHRSLQDVEHAMHARIITKAKGTLRSREVLAKEITAMRRALQLALVEGGRKEFLAERDKWKDRSFYIEFITRLDGYMTRMPAQRKRHNAEREPPRGARVAENS